MTVTASRRNRNVELLAVLVVPDIDTPNDHYRFLVDKKHVKYVTIARNILTPQERSEAHVLIPSLPEFPAGEWNKGHVSLDQTTGEPVFSNLRKSSLPGIGNAWHETTIDYTELKFEDEIRQTIYRARHPKFPKPVLAKFAQFSWEIPYFAAETTSYQWIHDRGIGPRFLGHIHEEGRIIGFVLEELLHVRTAEPKDLALCQRSLQELHDLGIKHGDINKHNFLISDERAVLIDFESTQKCEDEAQLREEYDMLEESLADTSGRGGVGMISDSDSD